MCREKNPQYSESLNIAKSIATKIHELGRNPSLHHSEAISGENRELLNKELGIYEFGDLKVLKNSTMPAILIEIGVIVDRDDEMYVTDENNQKKIISAIISGIMNASR